MADEFDTSNLTLRLEKELARKVGTKLIPLEEFDPALHNKVELLQEYEDEDNYLQINAPEGFVLVWENMMSADTIARLAEVIAYNELTDPDLISYVCEIAMEEPDFGMLEFIIKCYSFGQQVNTSKMLNYLGKNQAGEPVREWTSLYIKECTDILLDHRDDLTRRLRGKTIVDCQHKIECEIYRSIESPSMTKSEKYARLLAFSYISEALRKEGYEVRPAVMPQYLTAMLQERLRNNYRAG